MIKLVITEPCKECPWQQIRLMDTPEPYAMCIHQSVCKHVSDDVEALRKRLNDYAVCGDKTAQNAK